MRFKLVLLSFVCILVTNKIAAQTFSEYKRLVKVFKVNHASSIEIDNKYGKVHVSTWNKDSVSIEAVIRAKAGESNKLNKLLQNISFNFSHTAYFFTAKTVIGKNRSSFLSELKNFVSQEGNISIDYTIKAPKYINLKINNKYGDVYISSFMGKLNLNISNGELQADKLTGDNTINLKFSRGVINYVANATLNVSFDAEVTIKKAEQLTFKTNSAKINIEEVNMLKIDSKNDIYKVGSVKYLYGKTYFTTLSVKSIAEETSIENIYGNIELGFLSGFGFANITTKFTTYNLTFPSGYSYRLDASHKNSTLDFKHTPPKLKQKILEDDKRRTLTYGYIGKINDDSKVRINAEDSHIIFHKR